MLTKNRRGAARRASFTRTMKKSRPVRTGRLFVLSLDRDGHAGHRGTEHQAGLAFELPIIRVM